MQQISTQYLYTEGQVYEDKLIRINKGRIDSIEDFKGKHDVECLSAAFFDTHINGGEEYYLTQSNNWAAVEDIFVASVKTGTYYVLPTVITSSLENILKGIENIRTYRQSNPDSGVLGLHLEGPFLNPEKRGAHLAKYVRKPTNEELQTIIAAGKEIIKIWTIAPEQFEEKQIRMIQEAGITISAGHSNATYEEADYAFSKGISLVTHLYNAMSGLHHRKPGLVGASLSQPEVWAPIIPDGIHCHYGAIKTAYLAKPKKLFIISDALFLGKKKMDFRWEEFDAQLINGEYVNSDGNLAGSAISMGEAVKNMVAKVGITLPEVIEMCTARPAKAVGMYESIGEIKVGYPAVFTAFDQSLEKFEVKNFLNL